MELTALTAISPIDGRYGRQTRALRAIFSEYGLLRQRLRVELMWLRALAAEPGITEVAPLSADAKAVLNAIERDFSVADAERIKALEAQTNHDVKAVEYFIKEKIAASHQAELTAVSEFIHFACTSEDINNLAYALMLREGREQALLPAIDELIAVLSELAQAYADQPMLAPTASRPAQPRWVKSVPMWYTDYSASASRLPPPRC